MEGTCDDKEPEDLVHVVSPLLLRVFQFQNLFSSRSLYKNFRIPYPTLQVSIVPISRVSVISMETVCFSSSSFFFRVRSFAYCG